MQPKPSNPPASSPPSTIDRPEILIADDNANLLRLLQRILSDRHDVTTAATGGQALQVLESQRFEVVLTDMRMPGANGLEVLGAARRLDPGAEVVIMTAYASVPDAVDAMRQGAFDYLQKPFEPDDAVLLVARALEHGRRRRAPPLTGPTPREEARDEVTRPSQGGRQNPVAAAVANVEQLATMPYRDAVNLARDRVSRDYLCALMQRFAGNVTRAAEQAGVERESLHRLLKRYGVQSEDFKRAE